MTDERTYSCTLVRYRFTDEQRPLAGELACMALVRGVPRLPSEGPAVAAARP